MSRFKLEYDKVSGGNIIKDTEQREYVCTLEAVFEFLCDMDKQNAELKNLLSVSSATIDVANCKNAEYRKLIKEICGIVKNVGGDEWYDKTGEFLNRPEVKQILEGK